MATRRIILGSRLISLLMAQVYFNFNRVFNGFGFIFSNPRRVQVLLLSVKPEKIRNFQKWQNVIKKINCHKGSGKPRKFSRSWMMKRTAPLNSSLEI